MLFDIQFFDVLVNVAGGEMWLTTVEPGENTNSDQSCVDSISSISMDIHISYPQIADMIYHPISAILSFVDMVYHLISSGYLRISSGYQTGQTCPAP
jgi:hypothetical protein